MLTELNITPTIGNNFDECLSSDQFVAWELQDTMQVVDLPDSRHNAIRDNATVNYMREVKRRRIRHESAPAFIRKHFTVGDTVGIKIHKVDRTNTDSNILPCKILDIKIVSDLKSVYKIYSKDGVLKNYYSEDDLVDLRSVCFPGLNAVDPTSLSEITHIQACQKNRAVNQDCQAVSVCSCNGKCNTLRCSCKKAKISCSTKCHKNNVKKCCNK